MCTVSFIPVEGNYIITSNRDEHIDRPAALIPEKEIRNGMAVVYPKDPLAGGSWFAINENGTVAVLLNGAFEKHISRSGYAMSRGLVLLEMVCQFLPLDYFEDVDLYNIEPFTVIVFSNGKLSELRWDGEKKYKKSLPTSQQYIWSSATLYNSEVRAKREQQFNDFIASDKAVSIPSVIAFHSGASDDSENGFVINRSNGMITFSVTQAVISGNSISLLHHDLQNGKKHALTLSTKTIPACHF